jgi:8-oxo-dGTP pyrophosphatase MutT (NUDIX family)
MNEERVERREPEREGVIFLICKDGKVLLEDRNLPTKAYSGYRIIPGGKVEKQKDISHEEALKREAWEECGIEVVEMIHLDTFLHVTISNHLYNTSAYLITKFNGEVRNVEGKSEHIWVDFDEAIKSMLFADSRYVVLLAKQHLNGKELSKD